MFFAPERIRKIAQELSGLIYSNKIPVEEYKIKSCGYGAYDLLDADPAEWETFGPHQDWGGRDKHYWMKTTLTIPDSFEGKTAVLLVSTGREGWDALNPQFLAYVDGKAAQGLDVNHRELILADTAEPGRRYALDLYAYSGMNEGYAELNSSLCVLEREVEKLYYHLTVPLQVAELLDREDKRRIDILAYLTEAVNRLDLRKPYSAEFHASVAQAVRYLDEEFYGHYCRPGEVTEICIGHTHIDVAWLWTLAQTREKAARSFSTVLSLMKEYPDYLFMSSQPQLYQFVKEDQPELYREILDAVRSGRWEPEGAMWLEADCNLTSGESLVRQILHGKRFFRDEFGVDSKILWLPDVFGYSAALPQILKKSGIDYFMTTKISWNEFNRMPYDSFIWKGIDGTGVLTHFVSTQDYTPEKAAAPFTTYNGNTSPASVIGCWNRYQQKEVTGEVLNCFGFGDGGGGPTKEMLEYAKRLEAGIPGCPTVKTGKALDFFKGLEERAAASGRLLEWVGELYLEFHRGTYTSIARNKRYNRKTEFLNQQAELFASLDTALRGAAYPADALRGCWETTLLNQFHDIIPGSSTKEVYEDSRDQYEHIQTTDRGIISSAIDGILSGVKAEEPSVAVFNPLGFERSDVVLSPLPEGWGSAVVYDADRPLDTQITEEGILFYAEDVPSMGYKLFALRQEEPAARGMTAGDGHLENGFFDLRFGKDGTLTSVYDKRGGREVLRAGERGNVLQAFEDKPHEYDAWNIDIYYQEKMWEVNGIESMEVVENGPVRAGLKITRRFLDSTIEQTVYLYGQIGRIDFDTRIDWKEKQILLKSAFPVEIHSDKATYEIQFGNVERPTHWNTSWDWARFEVCAHKWADLSEGGYGVSLLNDCKYGHDIKGSVMRLTLLKSAIEPNVDADREEHRFVYSLYPHAGDWKTGGTAPMAYKLNCPMTATLLSAQDGPLPGSLSFFGVDCGNCMLETVKLAEDGSGDVIVRMYEYENVRGDVRLTCGLPIRRAAECDLLERELDEIDTEGDSFTFPLLPYEIKTFRISL